MLALTLLVGCALGADLAGHSVACDAGTCVLDDAAGRERAPLEHLDPQARADVHVTSRGVFWVARLPEHSAQLRFHRFSDGATQVVISARVVTFAVSPGRELVVATTRDGLDARGNLAGEFTGIDATTLASRTLLRSCGRVIGWSADGKRLWLDTECEGGELRTLVLVEGRKVRQLGAHRWCAFDLDRGLLARCDGNHQDLDDPSRRGYHYSVTDLLTGTVAEVVRYDVRQGEPEFTPDHRVRIQKRDGPAEVIDPAPLLRAARRKPGP